MRTPGPAFARKSDPGPAAPLYPVVPLDTRRQPTPRSPESAANLAVTYDPVPGDDPLAGVRMHALNRWLLARMNDPRDLPAVHTALAASLAVIPLSILLFLPGAVRLETVALYYTVNFVLFLDRFVLMMHVGVHRPWFHKRHRWLNLYVPNVLGLWFGQTIATYFAHHVAMHHAQDNDPGDLSSTRAYRRDSALDLARYLGRFLLIGVPALAAYFFRKGRPRIARRVIAGELATWCLIACLAWLNWRATLVVFVVPIFFTRTMMMLGNWAQHAFIDPDDPQSPFGLSTNIVASRHNLRCFNNGYHIVHHARPALHWSELPREFVEHRAAYVEHGAVVFEGVASFQLLALALIFRRYAWLESHLLREPRDTRSAEERMDFLRARTQPVATHA